MSSGAPPRTSWSSTCLRGTGGRAAHHRAAKCRSPRPVIVSTPQDLALIDARPPAGRSRMFQGRRQRARLLGVVENMSYFICPESATSGHGDIFGHGGRAANEGREARRAVFSARCRSSWAIREGPRNAGRPGGRDPAPRWPATRRFYREIAGRRAADQLKRSRGGEGPRRRS